MNVDQLLKATQTLKEAPLEVGDGYDALFNREAMIAMGYTQEELDRLPSEDE